MSHLHHLGSSVNAAGVVPLRPDRPRLGLMALLLLAAMPVRLPTEVPLLGSVSVLDLFLFLASWTLVLDLPLRPLNWGYSSVVSLMAVPAVASLLSVVWSGDPVTSVKAALAYLEGLVAYLFVVRELEGLTPTRVIRYIGRYALLLTIPAVLLLLHVPGFAPYEPGLSQSSGSYISYYTRLSHPVLGRSNNLAAALAIFVPPLLYWGHTRRQSSASIVGFITLIAVAATLSRGLFLAAFIAGLAYLLLLRRTSAAPRRSVVGKLIGVMIGLFVAAVALYQLNPPTREFFAGRLSGTNIDLRVNLYDEAFRRILDRPLLGYGADAAGSSDVALTVDVHNTYVQQVLNFGLPLGIVVGLAIAALPIPFLLRRRIHPIAGAIGFAVLIEVVSFCFESSFEGTVIRVILYLSLGLLTGLLKAAEVEAEAIPSTKTSRPASRKTPERGT
jgi:O-antigen ligase